jgi:DNA mismatch repair protein MutL
MRNRIILLEDPVIDKIAAGEVIERPSSVLKELLENAVDAGATSLRIELEEGGRKKILVCDDGGGMCAEDVPLAVKRHATSKLRTSEDLFCISSLGFRGEALASIASISQFSLLSREASASEGVKLETVGNEKISLYARPAPVGTTIQIQDLFFNVPVREKFLKSPQVEYASCVELLQAQALSNPHISFTLFHNGKEKISWPRISTRQEAVLMGESILRKRVQQVLALEEASSFLYVHEENQYGCFSGLVSPPGVEKATQKNMWTFVNSRWVKDKTIRYGILRGYHSHLLKGQYPQVVGFFTCESSLVDVNVHPTKAELRFQYAAEVQALLALGIRKKLRSAEWAQEPQSVLHATPIVSGYASQPNRNFQAQPAERDSLLQKENRTFTFAPLRMDDSRLQNSVPQSPFFPTRQPPTSILDWQQFLFQGSWFDCYLIFSDESRVLVIDQHAFHERILYEKYLQDPTLYSRCQPLLIPHLIAFSPEEVALFAENQTQLATYGCSYGILEGKGIEVTGVPPLLRRQQFEPLFASLLQEVRNHPKESGMPATLHHQVLATLACHSAVRAGENLTIEEVQRLKKEAQGVDFLHNCPHGRRVFKWFNRSEVEGWFDRT